ncbi:MAG: HEPN domain-containing protein [Vulcanococcus sp.]
MTPRAGAWIRQADSDLNAARCMQAQGFHAQACYLAAQAAEKALKALVVATGVTPPHSHSLERLLELLETQGLAVEPLKQLHLKPLTRMSSQTRYPQGDEAPVDLFDAKDSEPAVATATSVVGLATALLAG